MVIGDFAHPDKQKKVIAVSDSWSTNTIKKAPFGAFEFIGLDRLMVDEVGRF